jgi:hypothetical protein
VEASLVDPRRARKRRGSLHEHPLSVQVAGSQILEGQDTRPADTKSPRSVSGTGVAVVRPSIVLPDRPTRIRIAAHANVDPRTVDRVLRGQTQHARPLTVIAIEGALRALGIPDPRGAK